MTLGDRCDRIVALIVVRIEEVLAASIAVAPDARFTDDTSICAAATDSSSEPLPK
jgi:hypothetical protein